MSKKWLRLSQQLAGRADARMGGGSGWKGSVRLVCVCVSVSSVSLPLRLPSFASSLLPASASAPRPLLPCLPLPACLPPASAASGLGRALSIALNLRARADSHRFICKRHRIDKPSTKRLSPPPPGGQGKGSASLCVSVSLTVCLCVCMSRLKLGKEDEHCVLD